MAEIIVAFDGHRKRVALKAAPGQTIDALRKQVTAENQWFHARIVRRFTLGQSTQAIANRERLPRNVVEMELREEIVMRAPQPIALPLRRAA